MNRRALISALRRAVGGKPKPRFEVTQDMFAGTKWAPPAHMSEPTQVFHGTRTKFDQFDPFSHFGTKRAATDRLKQTKDSAESARGMRRVLQRRIAPGRFATIEDNTGPADIEDLMQQLWRRGDLDERDLVPVREAMQWGDDALAKSRLQKALNEKGIVALKYKNAVEDPGSTSFIVPDPRNITYGMTGLAGAGGMGGAYRDEFDR